MPIQLTEGMIRAGASKEIVTRGREYYREGAIYAAAVSGDTLTAKCRGSSEPHYQLRVEFDDTGIRDASCTCAYEYGGYCKHIVALLLAYLHAPDSFEPRADPQDLLQAMDRDQMLALLTALSQKHMDVRDEIERWVARPARQPAAGKANGSGRRKTVDDAPYRKRIRALIRETAEYYNPYDEGENEEVVQALDEIKHAIVEFLDADQPADALAIAMAVIDENRKSQDYVGNELVELDNFTLELDLPIAEAVLSMDLSAGERQKLLKALGDEDYGFAAAKDALAHGWDATGRAETGAIHDGEEDGEDEDDDEVDDDDEDIEAYEISQAGFRRLGVDRQPDVIDAQLNVLNRRGDHERYLSIALAAGRHLRYAQKLAELDRAPEAAQHAARHFEQAGEALVLAQQLHARRRVDDALKVATRGLRLAKPRAELGRWLAPIAKSRGDKDLAQRAWVAVFDEAPSLPLYQQIKTLAGRQWDKVKTGLLKRSAHTWNREVHAEILLYEQDWDAAVALADKTKNDMYTQVHEVVADGVMDHRPAWVVTFGKQRAEALIATVSSSHYPEAAEWLGRVKKAYRVLGQSAVWSEYFAQLKENYRRRPALQRELKGL